MRKWWRRLIARADLYFDKDWRIVFFQPILYTFVLGAAIRLAWNTATPPPAFDLLITPGFYEAWLAMGITCPLLALASFFMIRKGGRARVAGLWTRFSADVGIFTTMLSFHIVVVLMNPPTEARIFSRYIGAAAMIFVLELILRDAWALRLNEIRARRLRGG